MNDVPSHNDLAALAHAAREASVAGDADALHVELSRLRTALVRHLHAERDQLAGLRQTTRHITRDGQQRLLALVDELLSSTDNDDGTCNCLVRAAEIELVLRRQARLESTMLGRADPHPGGR